MTQEDAELEIFNLKETDFVEKKKATTVQPEDHLSRLDTLDQQLRTAAAELNAEMDNCLSQVKKLHNLAEQLPTVLSLRHRLVDNKRTVDGRIARTTGILNRNSAKLRNDYSAASMKMHEQNAKLKGENSYYEEEIAMMSAFGKFLEGCIKTVDAIGYQFKDRVEYEKLVKIQ